MSSFAFVVFKSQTDTRFVFKPNQGLLSPLGVCLKPTQDLYLNAKAKELDNNKAKLKPTQDLYLN